jgi:hypothetical protein
MADKKISALTGALTPLAGTEVLPIVQSGSTVKVSVANLTAGRTTAMSLLDVENSAGGGVLGTFKSNWSNTKVAVEGDGATGAGVLNISNVAASAALPFKIKMNGTEVVDVDTSGNLKATTGNFVVGTAAKGIDFSANTHAAGMTSELLNWYEEGTFTPTFTGLTVGNGTVFGYYRRIGKQVFVTYGFITGSTSVVAALTGVSGFPFTTGSVGASRFFPVTGVAFEGGVGWYGAASAIFTSATSGIGVFSPTNNVGFSAAVPFVWGADDSVSLTATYFVD